MPIVFTTKICFQTLLATAVPKLPDLTQPSQLTAIASTFALGLLVFGLITIGLGLALALINFALKPQQTSAVAILDRWTIGYAELLKLLQNTALIAILSIGLFLFCGTLANRYYAWEQSRFGNNNISTSAIEQAAPQIEYTATEPYSYNTQLNGRVVKVQDTRAVKKTMLPTSSNMRLKMTGTNTKNVAEINFAGEFQVKNTAPLNSTLILQMHPPQGLGLVENFTVEKDSQRLLPQQGSDYSFPMTIAPGATGQLRVSYRGQGAPRWLYRTQGQLLSRLQLTIETDLKNVDGIGSLVPTQVEAKGKSKVLTWVFADNASVTQPFGAGSTFVVDRQSGVLPRLLTVAPAFWLWWVVLLLMSFPLGLKDMTASAGVFLALISALTYGSRLIRTDLASPYLTSQTLWLGMTGLLILVGIGLARQRRSAINVALSATVGLVLPVFGLLGEYRGPILGVAALLSLGWLATPRWYGRTRRIEVVKNIQKELLLDGAKESPQQGEEEQKPIAASSKP